METCVLLLRGVNVGGAGTRLAMAELRAVLERLGCRDVATYIQSGNAVVRSGLAPAALADRLGAAITLPNGSHPVVLVLTAEEFGAALAGNPYPEAVAAPKSLHIGFLDREVTPDLSRLTAAAVAGERFMLRGRVFYLHAPGGFGRSRVAAQMEAALRPARITARNLSTVMALQAMARGLA